MSHEANRGTATPWQERFWRFVDPIAPSACWEWKGNTNTGGYGTLMVTKRPYRTMLAHRASWVIHNGGVIPPPEMKVCHHCDNRKCVNPAHLFLGTQTENIADMNRKGRHARVGGERHPFAKWTTEQVAEVRRLLAEGVPQGQISEATGVTVVSVKNIRRGARAHG